MSKKHERPAGLFALVQALGLCAIVIVATTMIIFSVGLVSDLAAVGLDMPGDLWMLVQLLCGWGAGVCLLWMLAEFVRMCGRVRKETAFTPVNVKSLGRIALSFLVGGALLLPSGGPIMDVLLLGMRGATSPLWAFLPTFAAWLAALMVWAIRVLLSRAVEMQTESDLTV